MCKMSFPSLRFLRNVGSLCVLQAFTKDARKVGFQFTRHPILLPYRMMVLSHCFRKEETLPDPPEKLDLDVWKTIMRSSVTEATEAVSDSEVDSSLTAMRELVAMWRQAGKAVPENMSEEEFKILQELSTKSAMKKYLKYLAIKESHKKVKKEKKERQKKARAAELEKVNESEENSGPKNTFLLQFWQRTLDNLYNWRAANAMVFGQPLVFDMSYENCMSRKELENTVSQLMECEGFNRKSIDPFHIHFCNLKTGSLHYKELVKRYNEAWDKLLITVTENTYIDIFPRDKLIYLTADSPHVMRTFEHDKIYIIGSIVDKSLQTGLSFANAKRLKLATARFPLDEFLHWETGAKNLTLDQVIRILLTLKDTGDWVEAFKFVPQRKHAGCVPPVVAQNNKTEMPKFVPQRKHGGCDQPVVVQKYKTEMPRNRNKQDWVSSLPTARSRESKSPPKVKPAADNGTGKQRQKKWWEEEE